MMSKKKIREKKIEKKMRKRMLTVCEAEHMHLLCPELSRRSWLLMSTVWYMS